MGQEQRCELVSPGLDWAMDRLDLIERNLVFWRLESTFMKYCLAAWGMYHWAPTGEVNLVVASVVIVKAHQQSVEGTLARNSSQENTACASAQFFNTGGGSLNWDLTNISRPFPIRSHGIYREGNPIILPGIFFTPPTVINGVLWHTFISKDSAFTVRR